MSSNNIVHFQESMTILMPVQKKSENLLNSPRKYALIYLENIGINCTPVDTTIDVTVTEISKSGDENYHI